MIKHFVLMLNPNEPKCNIPNEVPNFDIFTIFLRNPLPIHGLLPVETTIIAHSDPIKSVHDEGGPSPRTPHLNAIPKFIFDRFTHDGRLKTHCLEIDAKATGAFHSLIATALCQMDHTNAVSFPNRSGFHI